MNFISKVMCYINTFARSWSWLWWRICDPCYLLVMWATRWLLCHCDTWCVGILYNCLTCSMYATVMKSPLLANYIWLQLAITIEVLDSAIYSIFKVGGIRDLSLRTFKTIPDVRTVVFAKIHGKLCLENIQGVTLLKLASRMNRWLVLQLGRRSLHFVVAPKASTHEVLDWEKLFRLVPVLHLEFWNIMAK